MLKAGAYFRATVQNGDNDVRARIMLTGWPEVEIGDFLPSNPKSNQPLNRYKISFFLGDFSFVRLSARQ